jgi:hypothetical protein
MKNAFLKPEIGENRLKERSYIALTPSLLEPLVHSWKRKKIYFIKRSMYQALIDFVTTLHKPNLLVLFLARDGRQIRCPSWIWATSLCYMLLNKFVALVGSGQQTCRPSCDKKGLKDWAIDIYQSLPIIRVHQLVETLS